MKIIKFMGFDLAEDIELNGSLRAKMCMTWNSAGSDLPRRISGSNQDAFSLPDRLVIYLNAKCTRGTDSSFVINGVAFNTTRFAAAFGGGFLAGEGKRGITTYARDFAAAASKNKNPKS